MKPGKTFLNPRKVFFPGGQVFFRAGYNPVPGLASALVYGDHVSFSAECEAMSALMRRCLFESLHVSIRNVGVRVRRLRPLL